ncbi:MAG: peptide-methionine (R)-S-oxide reductase MsrB [Methylococcales symbiont of Iophon sp. n. MRB-2018]|nr:MAG: peptide-methionine (R)-S-oxide reductase MsrB [Methylococcales symbiont of Iophon sp. n. MRB-2018]KAF3979932.1 MAG: peptide-methionine (R)-S-oxide reductase MsrB [Methylococcales symbiont of Iophon sp. n. MRB-2018]
MTSHRLTEQQWQEKLTPEQFDICRKKGTERPFTGKYTKSKKQGVYHCVCCGNRLFDSEKKFDSGTGWPSFWAVIEAGNITEHVDESHGMRRVEVTCQACDAHLGHVFEYEEYPTGLRYCINSASLQLVEKP